MSSSLSRILGSGALRASTFGVALAVLLAAAPTYAMETYAPSQAIVIGEYIYNDDFTPTTDDCWVTITDPSGSTLVSGTTMTANADGWHYYAYTLSSSVGKWPAFMQCGTALGGDLLKLDKTFIVKAPDVTDASITSSVWSAAARTLTSGTSIASDIWAAGTRTLTSFGTLASDVWSSPSRSLTSASLSSGTLATASDVAVTNSLISALNDISASDVWAYGARSLTSDVDVSSASRLAIWNVASSSLSTSGSIGKQIVDNLDATISSRGTSTLTAGDVWAEATRTLTDYGNDITAADVWSDASRTLTNYGNDITAADVWNVLSSSLTTLGTIGEQVKTNLDTTVSSAAAGGAWSVKMGNVDRILAGKTYRTKLFVVNSSNQPTAPFATPSVTLYDPERNVVVSGVSMTLLDTGIYEYTYTTATSASQGLWEAVVSTQVESGKFVQTNDYWEVSGSPAQVIVNSIAAPSKTAIAANVTITNEGLTGYEYQYEWCVVSDVNNACGGGNDSYYALAAKFINPGEDWNTVLTADVPTDGTYYFKLVVYFGTESSGASRVFTVPDGSGGTGGTGGTTGGTGGGGGGGGGGSTSTTTESTGTEYLSADLNLDGTVNSIDFSILLAHWKTKPPYKNPRADINKDSSVNSIDFSIMLYQWKKKK